LTWHVRRGVVHAEDGKRANGREQIAIVLRRIFVGQIEVWRTLGMRRQLLY
jgi:hypothetical protein